MSQLPLAARYAALFPARGPLTSSCTAAVSLLPGGLVVAPSPAQRSAQHRRRRGGGGSLGRPPLSPVAAIRAVESFDSSFELTEEQSSVLNELLYSDLFCQQVVRDCRLPAGAQLEFTGVLFQPRPWTPAETKGMPADVERQYHGKPEQYTIINVPPTFMFQAKIFQPARLCAVYRRV